MTLSELRRRVWQLLVMAALCAALPACAGVPEVVGDTSSEPSAYLGWRLFQVNCARCHGPDGTGTDNAPDLMPRVRAMSEARFVATVLQRYQWVVPQSEAAGEGAGRDALVQDVLRRRESPTDMPAWEGEPAVRAHIDDLYRYLDARSRGEIGLGHPGRR